MGGLQQVHAFHLDGGAHGGDVGGRVDALAEDDVAHRLAGAMRHGRHEGGNGDQRRGLAFAPAFMTIGHDAHDEGILAAVADVLDLGHGEIEEVDGVDAHDGLAGWGLKTRRDISLVRRWPGSRRSSGAPRRFACARPRPQGVVLGSMPMRRVRPDHGGADVPSSSCQSHAQGKRALSQLRWTAIASSRRRMAAHALSKPER